MKKAVLGLALFLSFCFFGFQSPPTADLVIKNGKVHTVSDRAPEAQAVAVLGEKILAVGSDQEMQKYIGGRTRVLDVEGKLVIPGLIDSHTHFSGGGNRLAMLDHGAMLCWGTDWPVSQIDPMINLNRLVTRNSEQRLTMSEAIKFYTVGSAYASFEENLKGTLDPGKLADIVVLSKDLFTISPEEVLTTKVVYKILGGKIIVQPGT